MPNESIAQDHRTMQVIEAITPAQSEAGIIARRWPEAANRAYEAAALVDVRAVYQTGPSDYVVYIDNGVYVEVHPVRFSTADNITGGYWCGNECQDFLAGLMGCEGGAPYPRNWSGCAPMCVHVLAVEIARRAEALQDEPFLF